MKSLLVDDEFYNNIKSYAVFIPTIVIDGRDHILLEVRSHKISQPGEVSFPGGRVEEGESYEDAAIRETMEELSLSKEEISLGGYSSMLMNSSYKLIKAFYGRINKNIEEIKYNEEVESVFAVDIDFLKENEPIMYRAPRSMEFPKDFPFDKIPNGRDYKFFSSYYDVYFYDTEPVIWGMTAKFLKKYIESLDKDDKRNK